MTVDRVWLWFVPVHGEHSVTSRRALMMFFWVNLSMTGWLVGIWKITTFNGQIHYNIWWVLWNHGFFLMTFHSVGKNHHPNWRTHIFRRGRYTTNQMNCACFRFGKYYMILQVIEMSCSPAECENCMFVPKDGFHGLWWVTRNCSSLLTIKE